MSLRLFLTILLLLLCTSKLHSQKLFDGVIYGLQNDVENNTFSIVKIDSNGVFHSITGWKKEYSDFAVSPDGEKFVTSTRQDIIVVEPELLPFKNLDSFKDIYDDAEYPRPVKGGKGVIFATREIWVVNFDGSKGLKITNDSDMYWYEHLKWSPNGDNIYATAYKPFGLTKGTISLINAYTKNENKINLSVEMKGARNYDFAYPEMSPDSKYLVVRDAYNAVNKVDIYLEDLEDHTSRLYRKDHPRIIEMDWSPDGKRLLLTNYDYSNISNLWVDGTGRFDIKSSLSQVNIENIEKMKFREAEWSPDGNYILLNIELDGRNELWITDRNFRDAHLVITDLNIRNINWIGEKYKGNIEYKVSGELIQVYNIYMVLLVFLIVFMILFNLSVFIKYNRRNTAFLFVFSGSVFSLLFIYYDTAEVITIPLSIIGFLCSTFGGLLLGKLVAKSVDSVRKEFLLRLFEFGHSGNVTRNIEQLRFSLSKIIESNGNDEYSLKLFLENWDYFYIYSRTEIKELYRHSRRALYFKSSREIYKSLMKLNNRKIFSNNSSGFDKKYYEKILMDLNDLQIKIKKLEILIDDYFSINILSCTKYAIDLFEKSVETSKIDFHLITTNFEKEIARISREDYLFVLNNLIENAVKSMKDAQERKLSISLSSTKKRCYIKVVDTGAGLKYADLNDIFVPGFTKTSGTGFGLYKAREKLVKYKGLLDVEESIIGVGTTFLITLRVPEI